MPYPDLIAAPPFRKHLRLHGHVVKNVHSLRDCHRTSHGPERDHLFFWSISFFQRTDTQHNACHFHDRGPRKEEANGQLIKSCFGYRRLAHNRNQLLQGRIFQPNINS